MLGVCLDGESTAGGLLVSTQQNYVTFEGKRLIVVGDTVLPHGGDLPHSIINTMISGVDWITIDGKPVCFTNSMASCGHSAEGEDGLTCPG